MKKHILLLLLLLCSFSLPIQTQEYTSIFSFGDSFTDTGNLAILVGPATPSLLITKPPYGMTFPGHPTGRVSDGRLAIDFIETARRRRQDGGGVGAGADGVWDGEPGAVRGQERRRLRAGHGVPQGPEPALQGAQPAAPSGAGGPPSQTPRREAHLVIYADFYAPIIDFHTYPDRYGFNSFNGTGSLRACCGGGGRYNFNVTAACGMPGVRACSDPSAYVNWDGVHLTEAANRRVADGWLRGPYAHPPILSTKQYSSV